MSAATEQQRPDVTPFPLYTHAEIDQRSGLVTSSEFYGGRIETVPLPASVRVVEHAPLELGVITLTALGLSQSSVARAYYASPGSTRWQAIQRVYDVHLPDGANQAECIAEHFRLGFLNVVSPVQLPHRSAPHFTRVPQIMATELTRTNPNFTKTRLQGVMEGMRMHYHLSGVAPVTFMYATNTVVPRDGATEINVASEASPTYDWDTRQPERDDTPLLPFSDRQPGLQLYRSDEHQYVASWNGFLLAADFGTLFEPTLTPMILESMLGATHEQIARCRNLEQFQVTRLFKQAKLAYGIEPINRRSSADIATLAFYNGDLRVLESPLFAHTTGSRSARLAAGLACGLGIRETGQQINRSESATMPYIKQLRAMLGTHALSDTAVAALACGLITPPDVLAMPHIVYDKTFHKERRLANAARPLPTSLGQLVVPQKVERREPASPVSPVLVEIDKSQPLSIEVAETGDSIIRWNGAEYHSSLGTSLSPEECQLAHELIFYGGVYKLVEERGASSETLLSIKNALLKELGAVNPSVKGHELVTLAFIKKAIRIATPRLIPNVTWEQEDMLVLKHLATGASCSEIGRRLNVSTSVIVRRRQQLAIALGAPLYSPAIVVNAYACDLIAPEDVMKMGYLQSPVEHSHVDAPTASVERLLPDIQRLPDGRSQVVWGTGVYLVDFSRWLSPLQQEIAVATVFGEGMADIASRRNLPTASIQSRLSHLKRRYGFTHPPKIHRGYGDLTTLALIRGDISMLQGMEQPADFSEREVRILQYLAAGIKPHKIKDYSPQLSDGPSPPSVIQKLTELYRVNENGLPLAAYSSRTIDPHDVTELGIIQAVSVYRDTRRSRLR